MMGVGDTSSSPPPPPLSWGGCLHLLCPSFHPSPLPEVAPRVPVAKKTPPPMAPPLKQVKLECISSDDSDGEASSLTLP